MKKGYIQNIEKETLENDAFRKVLYTGEHLQLVAMSLLPGEDIGKEIHSTTDQFIRVESGSGVAFIDGVETPIEDDFALVIPAGSEHNVTNTGETVLKLYSLYGPSEHLDGTIHQTKDDAEEDHDKDHFHGVTTE